MNNTVIFVIIITFLIIFFVKVYNIKNLDHFSSDEAIQNLASLYNKDKLTIGSITTTEDVTVAGKANLNNTTANIIKANKLQLGDKFLMSGIGDFYANDEWLRFMSADGKGYAPFAAQKLWTQEGTINGRNIFAELDSLKNSGINCNWNGWNKVCGACTDGRDDYKMYCEGGKITHMYVLDNGKWEHGGWWPTG